MPLQAHGISYSETRSGNTLSDILPGNAVFEKAETVLQSTALLAHPDVEAFLRSLLPSEDLNFLFKKRSY